MEVSSEFLIIEDNKAVIKTLQKEINSYEYLMDFKQCIKKLDKEEVSRRLSSKKIGDKIKIIKFFSKEYKEGSFPESINFNDIYFKLHQSNVNSAQEILYDSYEEKEVCFNQMNSELQEIFLNEFLNNVGDEIDSKYNDFEKEESYKFIAEELEENNIAFCRDYNPEGWKGYFFKYKNIKIYRGSNLGFGSWSYDYINFELDGIKKIFGIIDRKFFSFEISYKTGYRINEIRDVLNEYLRNPSEFKKELLKNNIKFLKELLLKEQETIPKLENVIIPELEEKLKNSEKDTESYKKLKEEIEEYTNEREGKADFKYDSNTIVLEERKTRIELLKIELNNLIKLYKSEEDLLDYV
jgi:hypothetical protein